MSKVSFLFFSTIFVLLLVGLVKAQGTDCSETLNNTAQYLTNAQIYLCNLLEEQSFGVILHSGCDVAIVNQLRAVYLSARTPCAGFGIFNIGLQPRNVSTNGAILGGVINLLNG